MYVDMKDDQEEDVNEKLSKRVNDALSNRMSTEGCEEFRSFLGEFKEIFRPRLGRGDPAKVPPRRTRLAQAAKPMQLKPRRYPQKQHI